MKDYIALIRLPQYTKNLFIFLPLFFALRLQEPERLFKVSLAFLGFCLLASAVYIFNDLHDLIEDSQHPKKKYRPLPAGRITKGSAIGLMACLLVFGLSLAYVLSIQMFYLCLLYISLNLAYSVKLKHVPILDVMIVAACFVIRIFVGGAVGGVPVYMWIVIMTFLLALFLSLGKRRDDVLIFLEKNHRPRKSIDGYNLRFIDASMMIMAAVVLVAYLMYTVSPEIIAKFKTDKLYITSIFVLTGVMRYLQIAMLEENSGSPAEILMKDPFIQMSIAGWIISFAFLIYM
ncbi:MAG: decaprenyl-phosphate phosphoribosyltransferase [Deltaproteobacteria bacterium]|nr:decaprenyl-phosphate phosphoribosyltransferase [Deltaproteobacteria bacterium]